MGIPDSSTGREGINAVKEKPNAGKSIIAGKNINVKKNNKRTIARKRKFSGKRGMHALTVRVCTERKKMGFDKVKMKQIRGLILFVAAVILLMIYSKSVWGGILLLLSILQPFLIGGAIAFVLNIPLRTIEDKILKKWNGKAAAKIKRPISITAAVLFLILVINVVIMTVVPQITKTAMELGVQIPAFFNSLVDELEKLTIAYPQILEQVRKLESTQINWESVFNSIVDFLRNGMGSMLTSTVSVASSIIGGVVNTMISFIFAIYILMQKEKLACQGERILQAYFSEKVYVKTQKIFKLLYKNFSNFISGQCLEAVILGTLFVITMTIFRFPYAVMVGVLIAFTALIPIVGAFVGCFVGAFLILINNPVQAVWFVILFLVLQQIEGNLIYPRVVGNSVGLPSIWVLVAVSVGGSLMGIVGMLIFIPLVSTAYALLREDVNERNVRKKKADCPVPAGRPGKPNPAEPFYMADGRENNREKNPVSASPAGQQAKTDTVRTQGGKSRNRK